MFLKLDETCGPVTGAFWASADCVESPFTTCRLVKYLHGGWDLIEFCNNPEGG
eukprot:jgi/Botrbrau1/482/Bobra.110_2s0119.1